MNWRLLLGLITALAVGGAIFLLTVRLTTSTGERLADSLEEEGSGFAVPTPCEPLRGDRWRCFVEDDPGSGDSGSYLLRLDSDDCWTATRGSKTLRGCL